MSSLSPGPGPGQPDRSEDGETPPVSAPGPQQVPGRGGSLALEIVGHHVPHTVRAQAPHHLTDLNLPLINT